MNKFTEEIAFRERLHVFKDRTEAGRLLAGKLREYEKSGGVVFGIPSGGVPVALEISDALGLPMDILIVRKIQIPGNPEAGFGAVGPGGEVIFNEKLLGYLGLTEGQVRIQVEKALANIERRNVLFRSGKPYPPLTGKSVIIADDGLASGYTMIAAVRFIRKKVPEKIIVAVPTGSRATIDLMLPEADEIVCLNTRSGSPFAVADAYMNWYDLPEKEVLGILRKHDLRLGKTKETDRKK
jgi:putative phosphoribosyl transferase